jgi:hypothetical protein
MHMSATPQFSTRASSPRTLWKICSLLTSCNLLFKSSTFCVSVCTLSLSVLSVLARFANRHVEREFYGAVDARAQLAAAQGHVLRRHADAVLPGVSGAEGEAVLRGAALRDDAVVVVEGFFDGDEDADVSLADVGFGRVVLGFGVVVA